MLPTLALLATALPGAEPVTMKLIPSGAVEKAGGYRPIQAKLASESPAKAPKGLVAPQYGTIVAGTKKIAFALDEPDGKPATLVVDANGNGDLSDDAPATWAPKTTNGQTIYFGSATVEIGKDVPVTVNMYRFDPKNPQRAAMKDTLLYYFDYGYDVSFTLDGKPYTSFVPGEPSEGSLVGIDRNGDGKVARVLETAKVGTPFNFTGTTYKFVPTDTGLSLETVAEGLPLAPLPASIVVGKKTAPIEGPGLDGKPVSLLNDYKGKLVMIDFWATWCGPCIGELPNVKAAYAANHDQGFDILGISFDKESMADKVKEFTAKNEMPWRQEYEGKFWDTNVGGVYDINSIPRAILVDGDTGEIVADSADPAFKGKMRGPGLSAFIAERLAAKKARG